MKRTYLIKEDKIPQKAAFPAIDAHNHLWGDWQVEKVVRTMDETGIAGYIDLTSNVHIEFSHGGYVIKPGNINDFLTKCVRRFPNRFYGFTMASFAHPANEPLFDNSDEFVNNCIQIMREHVNAGIKGLKIMKELGLFYHDSKGQLINVDDIRLAPIWDEAGRLKIPVLIHQADPSGFFEPPTPENEHFESLIKYPLWNFADSRFPKKVELLKRRDNLIKRHPNTLFILPHVANYAENLQYVSNLLDENHNVYIDFSARLDELGRQPYSTRKLFIRHQDRILFGTDMPANIESSVDMYRSYFRFLETFDEAFYAPDYDGTFNRARWPICGIGLPADVLEKIYFKNIIRIIPELEKCI
jgi:predicted TIM-barrel fold metal-dependent hydrolase